MDAQHRSFGLIGFPLGHSYSKSHFAAKFERENLLGCTYESFEIPTIGLIRGLIDSHPDLLGLNVTIPYKQSVMEYLDAVDPVALNIGAVNTIRITTVDNRRILKGFNTDITGFEKSIARWNLSTGVRALVFGTGGSSRAITFALQQAKINYTLVSRQGGENSIPYNDVTEEIAGNHLLWINCTPVGMFPLTDNLLPLPYSALTPQHFMMDLIYNPEVTRFLHHGIQAGAAIQNGRTMLFEQAEASWKIWTENPDQ
jgi:shikimate dehydrogenase